ncbi:MAG: hypothetical protein OER86_01895, partial [Phycisphaerae bacterium]|nr:hypothetical protein [Phycisphaerae bacterium]
MPRKTSGKKTTRKQKPPHFGSAVLADDVSHRPPEKTDCRGLITVIKAWAYPCTRTFIVVFTLFDLPRGKTRGKAWIRKKQSRNKRPLSDFWLSSRKIGTIGTVTIRVSAVLEEEGPHEVLLTLDKHRATLATPLVV